MRGPYLPLFWIEGQQIFILLLISNSEIIDYFVGRGAGCQSIPFLLMLVVSFEGQIVDFSTDVGEVS